MHELAFWSLFHIVDALLGLDAKVRDFVLPQPNMLGLIDSPWEALPFQRS